MDDLNMSVQGPHSRACGISLHQHGIACSRDCPTCRGGLEGYSPEPAVRARNHGAFIRLEHIDMDTSQKLHEVLNRSGLLYAFSVFESDDEALDELPWWFPVTYESYTDEYPLPVVGRGQLDAESDIATINIEVYDPKWVSKLRTEGLTHLNLTQRTTD